MSRKQHPRYRLEVPPGPLMFDPCPYCHQPIPPTTIGKPKWARNGQTAKIPVVMHVCPCQFPRLRQARLTHQKKPLSD